MYENNTHSAVKNITEINNTCSFKKISGIVYNESLNH